MKLNNELIELAQTICKDTLAAGATKVMVAGGFVRDMLLDKPIKDIDVFYEGTIVNPYKKEVCLPKQKIDKTYDFSEDLFNQIVAELTENHIYKNSGWNVTIQETHKDGVDYPIQFIQCKEFDTHIDTFGCSLSKVFIDLNGLHLTNSFLTSVGLQIIKFDDINSRYAKRIKHKYPEYSHVE